MQKKIMFVLLLGKLVHIAVEKAQLSLILTYDCISQKIQSLLIRIANPSGISHNFIAF
jgi:hypothetical protein